MLHWAQALNFWQIGLTLFFVSLGLWLWSLLGRRKHQQLAQNRRTIRVIADAIAPLHGVEGNQVKGLLSRDGSDTLKALRVGIAGAQRRISISTYILAHDIVGREVIALLAARARTGVEVRLLIDAVGSRMLPNYRLKDLRAAGVQVARFNPVLSLRTRGSANWRNHRKIAVFDGNTAIIGGQNLGGQYIGSMPARRRFRDASFLIQGPAANHLEHVFLTDWCQAQNLDPIDLKSVLREEAGQAGKDHAEVIDSGPDAESDPLWQALNRAITSARTSIDIVTPYFIPDAITLAALTRAAREGIQVRVIVPKKSDHRLTDFARRPYLRKLAEAGAEIRFYGPGILHTKLVLIDKTKAFIGSANFDMRSLFLNYEITVLVQQSQACTEIADYIEGLAQESKEPSLSLIRGARTWQGQLLERLARLIAPLL